MKTLSERIKLIRKITGLTQEQLATLLGCTDGKVKAWEHGKTLTMKRNDINTLSNEYGFNHDWLEHGEGDMMINEGDLLLRDIAITASFLNDGISFQYYKDIHASAGFGCSNGDCKPKYITLASNMIQTISKDVDAIKVDGNSMMPTIEDEDIIFVDKNDTDPVNGKIYVIYLCEEVYVKRLFIEPKDKSIFLKSDNPLFPQINPDCSDFKIIGRVIANMKISKL